MTSLGMKIVGSEFEAGFTAGTREEFDSFIVRLTLMADSVWPKVETLTVGTGEQAPIDGGVGAYQKMLMEENRRAIAKGLPGISAVEQASAAQWKEAQGLR